MREARDLVAARNVGIEFTWPTDEKVADPGLALRLIAEASADAGVNVLRTSTGMDAGGRTRITHYLFLATDSTRLFDRFALVDGRWPTPRETREGDAVVTSVGSPADRLGRPRVFASAYDLTFAPLRRAYDALPVAGRYVVEGPSRAQEAFLAALGRAIAERGVADPALRPATPGGGSSGTGDATASWAGLLPAALVAVCGLVSAAIVLRQGKRIGVLALLGWSRPRIWFAVVGRLQLAAMALGALLAGGAALLVPGADPEFVAAAFRALGVVSAIGLGVTLALGLAIIGRVRVSDLVKGGL